MIALRVRIACVVDHAALKSDKVAWSALPLVGLQRIAADDTGPAEVLELRDCACGSTLCVSIEVAA